MNDMALVNIMVSVFGVVFATVWAGKEHRQEANVSPNTFLLEREQCYTGAGRTGPSSHPPVNLAITTNHHSDDVSPASDKGMDNQGNSLPFSFVGGIWSYFSCLQTTISLLVL